MKAALLQGIEQIEVVEVPTPACPEDGLLLRVAACGVCGGDVRSYFFGLGIDTGNRIMGHEITGEVVEIGSKLSGYSVGDRLALAADIHCGRCYYCRKGLHNLCDDLLILGKHVPGGFAEYVALDSAVLERGIVNRLPGSLSYVDGALSEPMCSVLAAQDSLEVGLGETVVVLGGGPIGCLHVEIARLRGAGRIILIEPSADRAEKARERFSVDLVISPEDAVAHVREATGGVGADVVIMAAPALDAVTQSVGLARKRGRVAFFGGLPKQNALAPVDANRIHYGELRVYGTFSYHPAYHRLALELLSSGRIDPRKFITTYPLDEVRQAILDSRRGLVFKAVLVP